MAAGSFRNKEIATLANQIESPAMLKALRRVQQARVVENGKEVDNKTFGLLQKLAALGLVDQSNTDGKPSNWTSNHNGKRVLRYFDAARQEGEDAAPVAPGAWPP